MVVVWEICIELVEDPGREGRRFHWEDDVALSDLAIGTKVPKNPGVDATPFPQTREGSGAEFALTQWHG
jgi:hypothetical protein